MRQWRSGKRETSKFEPRPRNVPENHEHLFTTHNTASTTSAAESARLHNGPPITPLKSAITMASFLPRATFAAQLSLPRSYFLGHHASGLSKMKTMLSSIDLIIECRDYRVPLTSRNPLFEGSLAGRERLVIYTKRDLGSMDGSADKRVRLLFSLHLNRAQTVTNTSIYTTERRNNTKLAPASLHSLYRP